MKISTVIMFFMLMQPVVAFMGASTQSTSQTALYGLPPKNLDNKDLQNIFYQNQAWKAKKLVEDPDFFAKLGTTHKPDFMWIGMFCYY
jgi:hypothetical protein